MSEKIPPRFRKTKTDKWAVMAPVADLEKALAEGGKIEVQKRSGDWSTFRVASLGKPFDVEGVSMCYGYGPDEEGDGSDSGSGSGQRPDQGDTTSGYSRRPPRTASQQAPAADPNEPLPEYQGGAEDEWDGF